jgi:hypothetical protein
MENLEQKCQQLEEENLALQRLVEQYKGRMEVLITYVRTVTNTLRQANR